MRVLIISLIAVILSECTLKADESLKVMTFNLRYASNSKPNAWPDRLPVMAEVIDKTNLLKDQKFTIIIKNLSGAVFPINYLVSKNPYNSVSSKEKFMEKSYDWFNRTFRSNFPYKD